MKNCQERKQKASRGRDTIETTVVHSTRYAAVVNARSWASVAIDDDVEILSCGGSTSFAKREC